MVFQDYISGPERKADYREKIYYITGIYDSSLHIGEMRHYAQVAYAVHKPDGGPVYQHICHGGPTGKYQENAYYDGKNEAYDLASGH